MTAAPDGAVAPLLVYVNVPFCNSKCHFCDWVAKVPIGDLRLGPESEGRRGHLDALKIQVTEQAPVLAESYRPKIMYWGGGTASILEHNEIETLYATMADGFALDGLAEATIESSPETLTLDKLRLLRGLGFDRISIGVQSFDDARLRMIGRVHNAGQAETSVRLAREAGFENINIDLIVGFPDEELAEVEATVRRAVSLPINHFSVYPYRATPGTALRRRLDRANAKTNLRRQLDAYRLATDLLAEHGHQENSLSYFGNPACLADDAYYRLTMDWVGFGSGAHSLVGGRFKSYDQGKLHRYIADPLTFDVDVPLDSPTMALHLISMALTTPEGMDGDIFEARTGMTLAHARAYQEVEDYLDQMREHGRLYADESGVRIHRDDIAQVFISMNWHEDMPPGSDPAEFAAAV